MDSGHPLEQVIAAYGDAVNHHGIEGILAMHTEDSMIENQTNGGKAAVKSTRGPNSMQPTGRPATWTGVEGIPYAGHHVRRAVVYVDSIAFLHALGSGRWGCE